MGNGASLTVGAVLGANEGGNAVKAEDTESLKKLDQAEVTKRLKARGIEVSPDDSFDSLCTCLALASSKGFWRKNAKLHPNFKRVKNWLWVHKRFRSQLDALANTVENGHLVKGAMLRRRLEAKIARHSAFEDGELFKYFEENIKDDELQQALNVLHEHHKKQDKSLEVLNTLAKEEPTAAELEEAAQATKKYVREMREHLALEEDTILSWWLNLSQEQYAKYRSYLSWMYAFMY